MCSAAIISPVHRGAHDINGVLTRLALRGSRLADAHNLQSVGPTKNVGQLPSGNCLRGADRLAIEQEDELFPTVETGGDLRLDHKVTRAHRYGGFA